MQTDRCARLRPQKTWLKRRLWAFLDRSKTTRPNASWSRFSFKSSGAESWIVFAAEAKHSRFPHACLQENPPLTRLSESASHDPNASPYIRRAEQREKDSRLLSAAIHSLAEYLQVGQRFRDLKIAEGLFYAGRRNQELAAALSISENEVAVVKRRLISRLTNSIRSNSDGNDEAALPSDLMTEVWELQRPSCPKRSTLGRFSLGILPSEWEDYVEFHLDVLGCTFCAANLQELRLSADAEGNPCNDRLFQSTIGFFQAR